MQASHEISISPPEVDAPQGDLERTLLLNSELEEVLENPVLAPVGPASNLSPSASAPVSASTSNTVVHALESRFLFAERIEILSALEEFGALVLISSFCYFFFLELPLVDEMRIEMLLVAVILGILSSTLALLFAMRFMWIYVALEFALVAVILFVFHSMLHLKPLWVTIVGSSILAFAISISLSSMYIQHHRRTIEASEIYSPV
ncbi:uncharacterized protein LOC127811047 [Diospyros lotus]|uniref:uncharacterized protein LOC127811047 n=1 Tax=Diospyros lotus TaxID=55363 RepID=UPI0022523CAF|nr:uncharacterized protein LOC127811047 [Diospyros lotus]XP_052206715.1 uncharacterized protein LOC127811047 [Diospyros lotus]XP_052206716.1 uncharacterized protein LOC127811047 [Diospyros lotus]XP_052206717.1 uncharacterized protein LOC127811047 [Diospyros lotus]XP_052206718.1 uncharacterized protein LOC127811047 [Diospyros lotus]XP_052206719.1 uncharacterized protein LOC127811047 [Diospyros lotus]XP_052206720.1 uncharacterized protein LOC127811047 [Diospyros lotus]XP_052206721.1 uncharacte